VVEYRVESPVKTLEKLLAEHGYASSGSDAGRKVKQGGVKLNGKPFTTERWQLVEPGEHVVEVGRRAFRLKITL
jgi:ribosome-associated protein YbcJ (S4-like RNA binding protein)